jgi:dihydrofolate reductase
MIIGIVAIAKNFAIGKDGKLPWHYSADLRFFRETTTGNAVVMGSTTWASIGKPLPNRLNVVLSRSAKLDSVPGVMQLASVGEVTDLARYLNRDVYIIGGAKVFESFAGVIERWVVTDIPVAVEDADVFMPRGFLDDFDEIDSRDLGEELRVRILQRRTPGV